MLVVVAAMVIDGVGVCCGAVIIDGVGVNESVIMTTV